MKRIGSARSGGCLPIRHPSPPFRFASFSILWFESDFGLLLALREVELKVEAGFALEGIVFVDSLPLLPLDFFDPN